MYESTHAKCILATKWTCVAELVKQSNVNDGFGNENYSGTFILLTGTLHTKITSIKYWLRRRYPNITLHQLDHGDPAVQCAN